MPRKLFNRIVPAAVTAALLTIVPAQLGAQPQHFNDANQLVTDLLSTPANVNVYDGDGSLTDHIDWTGNPRTAISVCGTFMTMLLKHSYGFTNAQFTARTGSTSPNAAKYHDAIVARSGFNQVGAVAQLLAGDLVVVKYPAGQNTSGHVMMVQSVGGYQSRDASTQDFLANGAEPNVAGFYEVTVIDSSASYHGPLDSRFTHPGGIGRNGVARIFVDSNFQITGYTWSVYKNSEYKRVADGYSVALGQVKSSW